MTEMVADADVAASPFSTLVRLQQRAIDGASAGLLASNIVVLFAGVLSR